MEYINQTIKALDADAIAKLREEAHVLNTPESRERAEKRASTARKARKKHKKQKGYFRSRKDRARA